MHCMAALQGDDKEHNLCYNSVGHRICIMQEDTGNTFMMAQGINLKEIPN